MNEEIKEILNNADSSTKFKMVDEDGTEKEMNIAGLIEQLLNDNKQLLDYITNLQQENENLKERYDLVCKISEERKNKWLSLNEENDDLFKIIKDYKSRCEKAIEYVDKICDVMDYRDYPPYLEELEMALKGDSDGRIS